MERSIEEVWKKGVGKEHNQVYNSLSGYDQIFFNQFRHLGVYGLYLPLSVGFRSEDTVFYLVF